MTKEEAEKLVNDAWPRYQVTGGQNAANSMAALGTVTSLQPMTPAIFIKLAVTLGMLELDEPKSVQFEFLSDIAISLGTAPARVIADTLSQRGLKIVEK